MSVASSSVDRARLTQLMEREQRSFVSRHPRSAALHERAKGSLAGRRADELDGQVGGRLPALRGRGARGALHGRRRARVRRLLPGRHRGDGGPRARRHDPRGPGPAVAGHHPHAADGGRDRRRRRAAPPVRPSLVAVHHHRDRCQPLLAEARPPHHRPAVRGRPRPLLSRLGGRDVCDAGPGRTGRRQSRQHRAACRSGTDDPGRRVQ